MTNTVAVALVATIVIAASAGCRTAPIHNVSNAAFGPAPNASLALEDVSKAIMSAGQNLDWRMEQIRPGELVGTLTMNHRHVAIVSITHNLSTFSITYKDSEKLFHQGNTIHKHYNDWIMKLEAAIQAAFAQSGSLK